MEHLTDGERDIRELPLKFLLQDRDDHIFRAEVIGVDQVDAKLLCREEASYFTSAVTKVSQPFAAASSSIFPPEPPQTAILSTGRPPSTYRSPLACKRPAT